MSADLEILKWLNDGDAANVALTAGTAAIGTVELTEGDEHIGQVNLSSNSVTVTPTITTDAYTANDCVGGIQTLANAARTQNNETILLSLKITDLAAQDAVLNIFFFESNPAAGTYTDNAELDIHDTDMAKCLGAIEVAAADYLSAKDNSVATVRNIGFGMTPSGSSSLYALVKTTGTPTYAVGDLEFTFFFLRD